MKFELPDQICEQIYRKVDLEYTKEDAYNYLIDNLLCIKNEEEQDEAIKGFELKYECTLDFALEEMAYKFYDSQDIRVPDAETWDYVIREWINERLVYLNQ